MSKQCRTTMKKNGNALENKLEWSDGELNVITNYKTLRKKAEVTV